MYGCGSGKRGVANRNYLGAWASLCERDRMSAGRFCVAVLAGQLSSGRDCGRIDEESKACEAGG